MQNWLSAGVLAGRGVLDAWTVFGVTWGANITSASAVYWLARRYGPAFFRGRIGRRLLPQPVLAHLETEYRRHGAYGIFISRLLPIWRAVVPLQGYLLLEGEGSGASRQFIGDDR